MDMIFEQVHSVSYCMGKSISDDLAKFTEILVQSYKSKYPKIEVASKDWDSFKIEATIELP